MPCSITNAQTSRLVQGDAKDDLCELADEWDADLLIMALGSTSIEAALQPCSTSDPSLCKTNSQA